MQGVKREREGGRKGILEEEIKSMGALKDRSANCNEATLSGSDPNTQIEKKYMACMRQVEIWTLIGYLIILRN